MPNTCPVCGFLMERPPADYRICPSCGTEFGYDDAGRTYADLRAAWLRSGAHWWSKSRHEPEGWDAYKQVSTLFAPRITIGNLMQDLIDPKASNQSTHKELFGADKAQSERVMGRAA